MRNFKNLEVWSKGMDIAVETHKLTKTLERDLQFVFANQMNRAAVSIPSNVAESCSRSSSKDRAHFIGIAIGSCFELITQYQILEDCTKNYQTTIEDLLAKLDEECKMLNRYHQVILKPDTVKQNKP